jgi:4-hydroxybenzoate polyprenyltransferase
MVVPPGRGLYLVAIGVLMAAALNAASNVLNQICDLEIDRVNKPERPLVRGELSLRSARWLTAALYTVAIALSFLVQPHGVPEVAAIVLLTALLTWAYSSEPLRLRRSWWLAPLVIALPRGGLLKVAGWGSVAPVFADREPWILGGLFFLFILGCASTKDFSDMVGDREGGVVSLPLRFGARRAALLMAPFYVLPWILLALFARLELGGRPLLALPPTSAAVVGAGLALHGAWTAATLVAHAKHLGEPGRGRRAWRNLYLLMMEAQIGVAALYLLQE